MFLAQFGRFSYYCRSMSVTIHKICGDLSDLTLSVEGGNFSTLVRLMLTFMSMLILMLKFS